MVKPTVPALLRGTLLTDLLFGAQIIGGCVRTIPMMVRNLTDVEGVSLSYLLLLLVFCVSQLSMAINAFRAKRTRTATQVLLVYSMWTVLMTLHFAEVAFGGLYAWDWTDAATFIGFGAAASAIVAWRLLSGRSLTDAAAKSQISMASRGIPQFVQAGKVALHGGAGYPLVTLLAGNLNIWTRLALVLVMRAEESHDPNRAWIIGAEVVNAVTWGLMTAVWIAWSFGAFAP